MKAGQVAAPRRSGAPPAAYPKVCLLIGTLGLGGAEQQIALLARGLHRRGVPTDVVTMFTTGPREAILREAGVPLTDLAAPNVVPTARGAANAVTAVSRLTGFLRRTRPDIVHAFLFTAYVLAPAAAALARVPVLVAGRRSLGDFKEDRRLALVAERFATARTRLLIANAQAVADDTIARERVPASKLAVIYNGLPASAFAPAQPITLDGRAGPVVVCVANLKAGKGQRYLLEACHSLRQRGRPVTVVLVGEGPQRAALSDMATRLGLDVRFAGRQVDVTGYLARADLAVLPSLSEGMSNSVMEAMAAGLPIVATDVGGTAELLAGRGVLVPPADPAALATAIGGLLADPARAIQLGAAAREYAARHLSEDVMVDNHIALYERLVSR